jgi:hypothetical protein
MSRLTLGVSCALMFALGFLAFEGASANEAELAQLRRAEQMLQKAEVELLAAQNDAAGLAEQADRTLKDNAAKVFLAGVLSVYDKVSKPDSWLALSIEVFNSLAVAPQLGGAYTQRAKYNAALAAGLRANVKIARMAEDLQVIVKSPLDAYDDDRPPVVRSAKPWWRVPDGQVDDEGEKITRKLNITRQVAQRLARQVDAEAKRIADLRTEISERIAELTPGAPSVEFSGSIDDLFPAPRELPGPDPKYGGGAWTISHRKSEPNMPAGLVRRSTSYELAGNHAGVVVVIELMTGESQAFAKRAELEKLMSQRMKSREVPGLGEFGTIVMPPIEGDELEAWNVGTVSFFTGQYQVIVRALPQSLALPVAQMMAKRVP